MLQVVTLRVAQFEPCATVLVRIGYHVLKSVEVWMISDFPTGAAIPNLKSFPRNPKADPELTMLGTRDPFRIVLK